jgi:hypothetical protein
VYSIWEINIFKYFKLYPMRKTAIKLLKRKQSISEIYSKYNAKRQNVWHIQYSIKNY